MYALFSLLFIPIGVWILIDPDKFLRLEDHFRVKGERTYSDFAIAAMRFRGVFLVFAGIFLVGIALFIGF